MGCIPEGVDLSQLTELLRDEGVRVGRRLEARLIPGGRSNLTYLLDDGERNWILRTPPAGVLLETAHDMRREFAVLKALRRTRVPVPTAVLYLDGKAGDAGYVMEFIAGEVLRSERQLSRLSGSTAMRIADQLVDVLALLHSIPPPSVGLGTFGRGEGYLSRQLNRWIRQTHDSWSRDRSDLIRLGERLATKTPTPATATLVHGDYRLDNVIFAPGLSEIAAVLDWEMATIGDPLADVASTAVWWDGMQGLNCPVAAVPGDVPSFPTSARLLERYAAQAGRDLTDYQWYAAFALFKVAAILEGVYFRRRCRSDRSPDTLAIGAIVAAVIERGHAAADGVRLSSRPL